MNLLTINSYDCSAQTGGGVNQVTVALTRYFTLHCNIRCFLGFFETIPSGFEPLPEIQDRIHLNRNIDRPEFEDFLRRNGINLIQVNFLKKENICAMPQIYSIAHDMGIKVIYGFHMSPLFQVSMYASREQVWYSITHNDRIAETLKFRFYTVFKPVLDPLAARVLGKSYRRRYDSCDKIVTLSSHYFKPYMDIAGIDSPDKFTAIGNALRYKDYPSEKDISDKEHTVLALARFSEEAKRLSINLRCWRRLEKEGLFPDWKLQMVGDGKDMQFYKWLVRKWNLKRVEFTGLQDPYEYCRRASFLMMASGTEGWPMVLMEAIQMGLPVVVMDAFGSVHDIIDDGFNGTIVRNNDLDTFYKSMLELMGDSERRLEYSRNAVESSKRFEIEKISEKWLAVFNELCGEKCKIIR
ncbi:MAG: glycosyltransferase [Bacteroidales bacterium]|nr:glycosyltransferase [Bacteroidales bacterium]